MIRRHFVASLLRAALAGAPPLRLARIETLHSDLPGFGMRIRPESWSHQAAQLRTTTY